MTGNFVMRMRRGKEVGSREREREKGGRGGKRVTEMKRERKGGSESGRWEAVGYENFSDVASPRFTIFHRTAAAERVRGRGE